MGCWSEMEPRGATFDSYRCRSVRPRSPFRRQVPMQKENNCGCVVCQVERSLLNSLSTQTARTHFQALARNPQGLSGGLPKISWAVPRGHRATGGLVLPGDCEITGDADPQWSFARRVVEKVSAEPFSVGDGRTAAIASIGGDCQQYSRNPRTQFRGRRCPRATSVESAAKGHPVGSRMRTRSQVPLRRVPTRGTSGEQRRPVGYRALPPHPEGCASPASDRRYRFAKGGHYSTVSG